MNILQKLAAAVASLREDEDAAETSEVILVLVVLVIGLLAAFAFLRNKIGNQASHAGSCLDSGATADNC